VQSSRTEWNSGQEGAGQVLFGLSGAMLINNLFTKYLGLCIFFGVSQKKTRHWHGITFTIVMVLSAVMCWAFSYVLQAPSGLS
jgi:electron transport complex protein RnfA